MRRSWLVGLWVGLVACPASDEGPTDGAPTGDSDTSSTGPTGDTGAPLTIVEGSVVEHGVVTCADPTARQTRPFDRRELGEGWRFAVDYRAPDWDMRFGAKGIVMGDFDGDGHVDLIVPQVHERTRLLFGDGEGGFVPGSDSLPDTEGLQGAVGGSAADVDGDGDLDVFLYGFYRTPPVLLLNDGTGRFDGEAHPEWDQEDFLGCGGSASFGDVDLDGDLDLFYGRLGTIQGDTELQCPSRLLLGDGTGAFVDASDQLDPAIQEIRVMASGFVQMDDDPHLELFVVADAVMESAKNPKVVGSNYLLDNGPDGLSLHADPALQRVTAGMGLAVGDVTDDGIADLVVPGVDELIVANSAAGTWIDYAQTYRLVPDLELDQSSGWGGEYADLDNDGDQELLMGFGAFESRGIRVQPDEIYEDRRRTDEVYVPVGAAWGWNDGLSTRGFLTVDLNGDGWLDTVKRELGGVVVIHNARCGEGSWLSVELEGPDAGNPSAVGAEVRVVVGGEVQRRWVMAGSTSFSSGGPPVVHVGLGDAEAVDRIEVRWPSGETTAHPGVAASQRVTVRHPSLVSEQEG